jgi:hypothetical protein
MGRSVIRFVSSLYLGGGLLAQLVRVASSFSPASLSLYNACGVNGPLYFFGNLLNRT